MMTREENEAVERLTDRLANRPPAEARPVVHLEGGAHVRCGAGGQVLESDDPDEVTCCACLRRALADAVVPAEWARGYDPCALDVRGYACWLPLGHAGECNPLVPRR